MALTQLVYRFPGEAIIRKTGRFESILDPGSFNGFIVSNFQGTTFYGFIEGDTVEEQHIVQYPPQETNISTYFIKGAELIERLKRGEMEKVVFSRIKKKKLLERDFLAFFDKLATEYPHAFCYWFDSPSLGRWMGATPELLVDFERENGKTVALAGTKQASDTSTWTEKEKHEQKFVAQFIQKTINEYALQFVMGKQETMMAGPVQHLVNRFEMSIPIDKQWEFIKKLHPTPAICGTPPDTALCCITELESHDRRFYCGIIGENYRDRKRLYVNLRSAQFIDDHVYLYVGGGFTRASDVGHEWEETQRKATTFTNLMAE